MSMKSSKIALSAITLITAALVLSGCSSDSETTTADDTSSESSSNETAADATDADSETTLTLSDGSPFTGEPITLVTGTDPAAPVITVSLPAGWTQTQDGLSGGVSDLLTSNAPEPSGFTPNTTVTVENQGVVPTDEVLAAARTSLGMLNGWTEVKYVDLEIDGQKAIRVAGTWAPPNVDVPVYAVVTVIAYQEDESSPIQVVSLVNQFTDTENLEISNNVEEINTSIEFG